MPNLAAAAASRASLMASVACISASNAASLAEATAGILSAAAAASATASAGTVANNAPLKSKIQPQSLFPVGSSSPDPSPVLNAKVVQQVTHMLNQELLQCSSLQQFNMSDCLTVAAFIRSMKNRLHAAVGQAQEPAPAAEKTDVAVQEYACQLPAQSIVKIESSETDSLVSSSPELESQEADTVLEQMLNSLSR